VKHAYLLLPAVLLGLGCAADGNKAQWDEVLKDLRGDNMQMRTNFSGIDGIDDHPVQPKSRTDVQ
jgi:hypothetical protein